MNPANGSGATTWLPLDVERFEVEFRQNLLCFWCESVISVCRDDYLFPQSDLLLVHLHDIEVWKHRIKLCLPLVAPAVLSHGCLDQFVYSGGLGELRDAIAEPLRFFS